MYHVLTAAHLCRLFQLLHCCILVGILQVLLYSIGKQDRVLQDNGDIFPKFLPGDVGNALTVYSNAAAIHIVKSHQKIYHSGLSAAGIGKGNIPEFNFSMRFCLTVKGTVFNLRFRANYLFYTLP